MKEPPQGPRARATFIVRLTQAGTACWQGVVELVDVKRRAHVTGGRELVAFIDEAFAERSAPDATPAAHRGGSGWN